MTVIQKGSQAAPRVTVLMPVYNGLPYLGAAIKSILAQTYGDFEFVIVDDASLDDTLEVARSYADPRVRLLRNATNQGLIATLNIGLAAARGEYIARMDHDDISLPGRLMAQVDFLDQHPQIGVLGTGCQLIDADGNPGATMLFPASHPLIRWGLAFFSPLVHPTVMMRRSVVSALGGYRALATHCEDYDLWWRASMVTRISNLQEVLLMLRKHDASVTAKFTRSHRDNAREVCRAMLAEGLHIEVPSDLISALWGETEATDAQIRDGMDVFMRHYRDCLSIEGLSLSDRAALERDLPERVYQLVNGSAEGIATSLPRTFHMLRRYSRATRTQALTRAERRLLLLHAIGRALRSLMKALRAISRWTRGRRSFFA